MVNISKTMGPIHFEDLDPHRFEDMARQLIYDFRDWQSIEPTGKGGNDDGFDIRAWERINTEVEHEEGEEPSVHPMEGNLWMIQCKREKELGPKRVEEIINETVNEKNPPYGYILIAATNFSKTAFDKFRESLRKKGVQEFYLWGKAALEDMLSMPKNDRILFTFFGISLTSRRRSKRTEIRFSVVNKNKLIRILGGSNSSYLFKPILVRDAKDSHYPWKGEYKDFDTSPRWKEYFASHFHPLGLLCNVSKYYAYLDQDKKEWDFIPKADLLDNQRSDHRFNRNVDIHKIEDFWEYLPQKNKVIWEKEGLIKFEDMDVIDDKGDVQYDFPHIYVDFKGKSGLFYGFRNKLSLGKKEINFDPPKYKKVGIFPKEFPVIQKGIIYKDRAIELNKGQFINIKNGNKMDLISIDERYNFLNPRDEIAYKEVGLNSEKKSIKVLYKYETTVEKYLQDYEEFHRENIKRIIEDEVGRGVNDEDKLSVLEFKHSFNWDLEKPE